MRVLVVDDDPAVRHALARALRLEGYEVELAAGGGEALTRLALSSPDAVVLDVLMPEVDGLDVCRRLRAAEDRTPVLMLTARDAARRSACGARSARRSATSPSSSSPSPCCWPGWAGSRARQPAPR